MDRVLVLLLVVCLIAGSSHWADARRRPVRSVLAPAETINNYDVVIPTIIHQSKDTTDGYPHEIWVRFSTSNETFELHLTMNRQLLAPRYKETYMEGDQMVISKERKNCYYHGRVVSFPDWSAAISTCTGLRGSFGDYGNMEGLYHMEPLERTSNDIGQAHILYLDSELSTERRNGTCGYKDSHKHMMEPPHNFTTPHNRVRRQSATRIVEWVIVNDRRQFIANGNSLSQTNMRSIDIANTVDLLYAKIGVRVALIGVLTWTSQDFIAIVSEAESLLTNFQGYRTALVAQYPGYDSAMLVTGIDLDGQTIGIAPVGAMCTSFSNGLTQDTRSSVASVGATAAHELGHIFDMNHDDGRGCTCNGLNNLCIMSSFISNPPPVEWSSCSVSEMNAYLGRGFESCLLNEPSMIFGDPACGNGIREGEEVCDCGTPQMCDDPCCDATTCQLAAGATCSNREACCSNCQFRAQGTQCRAAADDCDIVESCTGTSGECPADRSLQNGADCANGQAYCFDGRCQNLDNICQAFFAPSGSTSPAAGPQECFNLNTRGDVFGNCGHNSANYLACASANVNCGQLQCINAGDFIGSVATNLQLPRFTTFVNRQSVRCSSFTSNPGSDIMPGLVPDGARCGDNRVCMNRQCATLQITPCPSANSLPCSGNGQCNDLNQCSCDEGFIGANCNTATGANNVNGGWSQWTSWSSCTLTCGGGARTRTRTCSNPTPQGSGADCVGSPSGSEGCNMVACPVDGQWGAFGSWSSCSVTCGAGGQRTRQRVCDNPQPSGGGEDCSGSSNQQENCSSSTACPVNGQWGAFGSWSSCSVTCGGGVRTRERSCDSPPPSGGGADCEGSSTRQRNCNIDECPVAGGWGSWSSWTSCSVTCGDGGQMTRQRVCDSPPPSGGGADCEGTSTTQQECNVDDCPVNGNWGSWTSWSSCSATCGGGVRTRQRSCDNPPPSGGGINCLGVSLDEESCGTDACPDGTVNGVWGPWTSWSPCSTTCGNGQQTRQRECDNPPPSSGGMDCVGNATGTAACSVANCPTGDGGTDSQGGDGGGGGSAGAAIGGAIAAVVIAVIVVIIIVVAFVVYRRRKGTKYSHAPTSDYGYSANNVFVSTTAAQSNGTAYPPRPPAPARQAPPPVSSYIPPPATVAVNPPQRRAPPVPPGTSAPPPQHPAVQPPPPYSSVQNQTYPTAPPKPQAAPKPQAPSRPKTAPKPQAPSRPGPPETAPRTKPRVWPPVSENTDGRGPPPTAPRKPLKPPPRN